MDRTDRRAEAAAALTEAAMIKRERGRAAVAAAITVGNTLAEDYRRSDVDNARRTELDARYDDFEKIGTCGRPGRSGREAFKGVLVNLL